MAFKYGQYGFNLFYCFKNLMLLNNYYKASIDLIYGDKYYIILNIPVYSIGGDES